MNNQSFRGSQTHMKHQYNAVPVRKGEEVATVNTRRGAGGIKNTEYANSVVA